MKNENLTPIKRNDTCIVCGAKFEPRKDKLYCSDTCKQKAYNDRKQLAESGETENKSECLTNEAKQNILYTFYFKEYQLVLDTVKKIKLKSDILELTHEEYCFFRKNLPGKPSIEYIINYIERTKIEYLFDQNSDLYKKFNAFMDIYYTRSITINDLPEYLKEVTENS